MRIGENLNLNSLSNIDKRIVQEFDKLEIHLNVLGIKTKRAPAQIYHEIFLAPFYQKASLINRLHLQNILAQDAIDSDLTEAQYVWNMLNALKAKAPEQLFEMLKVKDYIEIRDLNGVQVAANLNFLKVLSYSLEELFWYPWDELFTRDQKITTEIMNKFFYCITEAKSFFDPEIPEHICSELKSLEKRSAIVKMNIFCPLKGQNNSVHYMLACSELKPLIN